MRYHHDIPKIYSKMYGKTHYCNHPVYRRCTLFQIGDKGLAVIQQRYNERTKQTWWSELDEWLNDDIYLHPNFKKYFDERAAIEVDGIYPTVTVRQIMWGLKMKPLPKERWETYFDRQPI